MEVQILFLPEGFNYQAEMWL